MMSRGTQSRHMIPDVTLLQLAVLDCLYARSGYTRQDPKTGHTIRTQLVARGVDIDGTRFYQLMQRMVNAKLVTATPQAGKRTNYQITGEGEKRFRETKQFLAELAHF